MGNLYLVRHGQASFGAADYDNLSELGHRQSVRLGGVLCGQGAAISLAAAMQERTSLHGQTAGITLCGGHVDSAVLAGALSKR